MAVEPTTKRTIGFIDGQNLFYAAKEAFGYTYPNYEPVVLVNQLCVARGWQAVQVRFYTGIPDKMDNPFWNHFWTSKLAVMGKKGVCVFSRSLRYRNQTVQLPDGSSFTFLVPQEKGVGASTKRTVDVEKSSGL